MDMSPLVSAVLSFVFVIGLLLATLWFVRARGIGVGSMNARELRVVNSLRLGNKHRLDVVDYAGRRLLIGVAPNQITLLDNQPHSPESEDELPDQPAATQNAESGSFAGQLRQLLDQNRAS